MTSKDTAGHARPAEANEAGGSRSAAELHKRAERIRDERAKESAHAMREQAKWEAELDAKRKARARQ
jgi:hypothetical protein